MKLTSKNVETIFLACLYQEGEDTTGQIQAEGITNKFGFNPGRLSANEESIKDLLFQLPKEFMRSGGGGYTFLNGCLDAKGDQWGEQTSVHELLCLGLAIGKASYLMPREMWSVLPGGVPYFVVHDTF